MNKLYASSTVVWSELHCYDRFGPFCPAISSDPRKLYQLRVVEPQTPSVMGMTFSRKLSCTMEGSVDLRLHRDGTRCGKPAITFLSPRPEQDFCRNVQLTFDRELKWPQG